MKNICLTTFVFFCICATPVLSQNKFLDNKQYERISLQEESSLRTEDDVLIAIRRDNGEGEVEFMPYDSTLFSYDAMGNVENELHLFNNDDNWQNWYEISSVYDEMNLNTSNTLVTWNGLWVNSSRNFNEYNTSDQIVIIRKENWLDQEWKNAIQAIYTYDSNQEIESIITQLWVDETWNNKLREAYSYELDRLKSKTEQIWYNETWNHETLIEYEYDENDNIIIEHTYKWEESDWIPYRKIINQYNSQNNKTSEILQQFILDEFVNWTKNEYIFNLDEKIIQLSKYAWDESNWMESQLTLYEYDERQNLIYDKKIDWDNSEWVDLEQAFYYYDLANPTLDFESTKLEIKLMPNPNQGAFKLQLNKSVNSDIPYRICNALGETVFNQVFDRTSMDQFIQLPLIKSGYYFIQFESNGLLISHPFIMQSN